MDAKTELSAEFDKLIHVLPLGPSVKFAGVLVEMLRLHAQKGHDYGTFEDPFANVRASDEFGIPPWQGSMMRANDKVSRLKTYSIKHTLQNEGVEDSMIDLACYAVIALVLFRE